MTAYTLVANTGIQLFTFRIRINLQDKLRDWFHEWYDSESGEWKLELVHEVASDMGRVYFPKNELIREGFLAPGQGEVEVDEIRQAGISPLMIDSEICQGVEGQIYSLSLTDRDSCLASFEGQWLPLPYFFRRTPRKFKFGPLNWARCKLSLVEDAGKERIYDVVLAFDTRTTYEDEVENENPSFVDRYATEMDFALCDNPLMVVDFMSPSLQWGFVDQRIFSLVHPELAGMSQIRGANAKRTAYAASYILLLHTLTSQGLFPQVKLFKDHAVEVRDVDMVVDVGNSRTTAILVEDGSASFSQVSPLSLLDFSNPLTSDTQGLPALNFHDEPFDMRLAFRKADFGGFGPNNSPQFVYPSLVRLGEEANWLIHSELWGGGFVRIPMHILVAEAISMGPQAQQGRMAPAHPPR